VRRKDQVELTGCHFESYDRVMIAHQGGHVIAVWMIEAGKTKPELLPNYFGEFLLESEKHELESYLDAKNIRESIKFANKYWHNLEMGFSHVGALRHHFGWL